MATRLAAAARNAACNGIVDLVDAGAGAGTLKIYSGTQPANGDAAEAGTLLATVTLADPAFGNASAGVATGTDPAAVDPVASGNAGWFRVEDSTGANVYDGSVTATGGGGDLQLSNIAIGPGINVDITSLSFTVPAG